MAKKKKTDADFSIESLEEAQEKSNARLAASSKELYECVFREIFWVEQVIGESYAPDVHSYSAAPIGSSLPAYRRNPTTSKLVLTVRPVNNIPVRELIFEGTSPVMAGQDISVLISKYKTEQTQTFMPGSERTLYFDREYRSKESAIEIKILSEIITPEIKPLRTDRSIAYSDFVKKDN